MTKNNTLEILSQLEKEWFLIKNEQNTLSILETILSEIKLKLLEIKTKEKESKDLFSQNLKTFSEELNLSVGQLKDLVIPKVDLLIEKDLLTFKYETAQSYINTIDLNSMPSKNDISVIDDSVVKVVKTRKRRSKNTDDGQTYSGDNMDLDNSHDLDVALSDVAIIDRDFDPFEVEVEIDNNSSTDLNKPSTIHTDAIVDKALDEDLNSIVVLHQNQEDSSREVTEEQNNLHEDIKEEDVKKENIVEKTTFPAPPSFLRKPLSLVNKS
jgi:hypothetical protein